MTRSRGSSGESHRSTASLQDEESHQGERPAFRFPLPAPIGETLCYQATHGEQGRPVFWSAKTEFCTLCVKMGYLFLGVVIAALALVDVLEEEVHDGISDYTDSPARALTRLAISIRPWPPG